MSEKKKAFQSLFSRIEFAVEQLLWGFRFIIILGVFGLLFGSIMIFFLGTMETFTLLEIFGDHIRAHGLHFDSAIVNQIILHIIMTVDDFLLGIVLLIFALGSYDLFISKIEIAEKAAARKNIRRPNWLKFRELDELKTILGKVVLMILIINFLKFVIKFDFQEPLEILYLAGGIFLISLALKFSHGKDFEQSAIKQPKKKRTQRRIKVIH